LVNMPKILGVRCHGSTRCGERECMGYTVGVYQPFARKADGVKTLRLVGNVGECYLKREDAVVFGEQFCKENENEYFFFDKVKQGYHFDDLPEGVHLYFELIEAME